MSSWSDSRSFWTCSSSSFTDKVFIEEDIGGANDSFDKDGVLVVDDDTSLDMVKYTIPRLLYNEMILDWKRYRNELESSLPQFYGCTYVMIK